MILSKRKKGSLTIEAVISFSIFVSFMFMLLSMVKISLVKITIDNAINEAAKQIAAAAYPVGMFNDVAEDNNKTVAADLTTFNLATNIQTKGISALYDIMFSGTDAEALKSGEAGLDSMFKVVKTAGTDTLKKIVFTGAEKLISQSCSYVTGCVIADQIDNTYSGINKKNLTVTIAKIPVPKQTYDYNFNTQNFLDMGLTKSDFNEDDVVIGVEYVYKLALPFITTIDVKMRDVVVEHAWVNGGAGNISTKTEGIKIDDLKNAMFGSEKVYITKTGHKYHKATCFYLWNSKIEKKKSEVVGSYAPCSRCSP